MNKKRKEKREYLHLFNVITAQGEKVDNKYEFNGISAWHDFDGYTCWLQYNDLLITLLFHNKYEFSYDKEDTVTQFHKKIEKILTTL